MDEVATIDANVITELTESEELDTMVGLPSWQGGVMPETQICLDHLCYHNVLVNNKVTIKKTLSSMICSNRDKVITAAIEKDAKYVLLVDTDMVFPADAIQQMKAHQKPVVSALATSKVAPFAPNMYRKEEMGEWSPVLKWEDNALIEVDCVGGAFMLVETDVFRNIRPPWYSSPPVRWHFMMKEVRRLFEPDCDVDEIVKAIRRTHLLYEGSPASLGEDYFCSERIRDAGYPIHVDTSMKIGHIGKRTYSYWDLKAQSDQGVFDGPIHGD